MHIRPPERFSKKPRTIRSREYVTLAGRSGSFSEPYVPQPTLQADRASAPWRSIHKRR